jgi:dephospho-CoA kinase
MITFGIVGGVASGKSLVSQQLAELGAGVLDADRAGHDVLANDPEVRAALLERWGPTILAEDGSIDRRAIASRVFGDSQEATASRAFLEHRLHPRIRRQLDEQRKKYVAAGCPAVVLDAPLLLEAGWGEMCDVVLSVDTPREIRLLRAKKRGWSEAEFDRREAAQWSTEEKQRHASVVIQNSQSADELRAAVRRIWSQHVHPQ